MQINKEAVYNAVYMALAIAVLTAAALIEILLIKIIWSVI